MSVLSMSVLSLMPKHCSDIAALFVTVSRAPRVGMHVFKWKPYFKQFVQNDSLNS